MKDLMLLQVFCTNSCHDNSTSWVSVCTLILGVFTLILGIIGAWEGFHEYQRSNNISRSAFIEKLIERLKMDEGIRDLIYKFQYDQFKYDENFHGQEIEKKVDRLLHYFTYLCYLKDKEIISDEEFGCFEIFIKEVLENKDLRAYLYCLYHQDEILKGVKKETNKKVRYPFTNLISYGKEIDLIKDDFFTGYEFSEYKYWEEVFKNRVDRACFNQSNQAEEKNNNARLNITSEK